jgi:hypothetical protein
VREPWRVKQAERGRAPRRSMGPFVAESSLVAVLLSLCAAVGLSLLALSRTQPFPEPSRRFGGMVLCTALLLMVGTTAPRPPGLDGVLWIAALLGGFGVVVGLVHMVRTRRDVVVAPLSGFLLCAGVGGLMASTWADLSKGEQWVDFVALVMLTMGQVYLVFRGLLIGKLPLAWSQAGLVALQRGQLEGPRGAIACFERGWAVDEPHLNPMAYLALARIEAALGHSTKAEAWLASLASSGGEAAVAPEWVKAVESALIAHVPDAALKWSSKHV